MKIWRWHEDDRLTVYALTHGDKAYVGVTVNLQMRLAWHKSLAARGGYDLIVLETDVRPEDAFKREAVWAASYRESGYDLESLTQSEVGRLAAARGQLQAWLDGLGDQGYRDHQSMAGRIAAATKFVCSECGMQSHAGPLARHQNASGHRGKTRV